MCQQRSSLNTPRTSIEEVTIRDGIVSFQEKEVRGAAVPGVFCVVSATNALKLHTHRRQLRYQAERARRGIYVVLVMHVATVMAALHVLVILPYLQYVRSARKQLRPAPLERRVRAARRGLPRNLRCRVAVVRLCENVEIAAICTRRWCICVCQRERRTQSNYLQLIAVVFQVGPHREPEGGFWSVC